MERQTKRSQLELRQLEVIGAITEKINRGRTFEGIFESLHDELSSLIPCSRLAIGFLQPDGHTLVLGPVVCDGALALKPKYKESIRNSSLEALVETGRTRIIDDLEAYLAAKPGSRSTALIVKEGMRSSLTVPLVVGGRPVGVMWFSSRSPHAYSIEHESFIRMIAGHLAITIEKGWLVSRLEADNAALAEANELKSHFVERLEVEVARQTAALRDAYREIEELKDRLQEENLQLRDVIARSPALEDLIGESPAWRRTLHQVELVAPSDTTVLIHGETGTGKEVIARALHRLSPRRERPFVAVNCGALSAELVASELFGHEKGAFTGAHQRKLGRMELASGGTLFLDEVGELAPEMQVKLLRVLQEREFERVGGTQSIAADVRVIAATNRDLDAARAAGQFRDDLYFRLAVFPIAIPSLRERREDVEPLIVHFLSRYAAKASRSYDEIDARSLRRCRDYAWPGNVRELENLVERSVILSPGRVFAMSPEADGVASQTATTTNGTLDEQIKAHLCDVLAATRGKIYGPGGAAERLGLKPSTLQAKLKKYGLSRLQA